MSSPRTADEIRAAFLGFFAERGHRVVKSASLVPQNDPTLLFTNAGMVQFKNVFTGQEERDYSRAASSQRCVRAGGKHNDLENVGFTARHHTFFEMLGNFSFGDYFKQDAIAWAWEFVTRTLQLPKERIVVTVFEGGDGVPADEEAEALWRGRGVRPERIFRLGKADNFWQMGDTGPCGPCTEIHVYRGDLKTEAEIDAHARDFFSGRLGDTDDWMEIWNLVFMQFDRSADGTLTPLPKQSVDTGAGLERLASVVQGVPTNYDTDLLRALCECAGELAGKPYPAESSEDTASLRVIADHARATAFLVSDGVMPANEGRGYVLRRIMRRAIRHGKRLGIDRPFFDVVCQRVVELMGEAYPELRENAAFLREVVRNEEEGFRRTLTRGLALLDEEFAALSSTHDRVLRGETVFRLYDTFGFPVDLTRVIANERGFGIDEAGFEREMSAQRERSSFGGSGEAAVGEVYRRIASEVAPTTFLGYGALSGEGRILRLVQEGRDVSRVVAPARVEVVVDRTPFYGESGGQLGDKGTLTASTARGTVQDAQRPVQGIIVHEVDLEGGELTLGEETTLTVDADRRAGLRAHHSATHLLHHVLREVLGDHVKQAGSVVAPDYLRFDYTHFAAPSPEQLREIERRVNRLVVENHPANTDELELEEAKRRGAIAFFGEKYGETVRVLTIGPSVELCGGTHVGRTGDIGFFKISSESAIASGVRRVVAVTGLHALSAIHAEEEVLAGAAAALKCGVREVAQKAEASQGRVRELEKEVDALKKSAAAAKSGDLLSQAADVKGVKVLASRQDGEPKGLRDLADKLRDKMGSGVVALGAADGAKALLLVAVTKDLVGKLPAKALLDDVSAAFGGRGGGKPDLAQAGGDPSKLDAALEAVVRAVEARLG